MTYETSTDRIAGLRAKLQDIAGDACAVAEEGDRHGWTAARREKVKDLHAQALATKQQLDDEEQGGELARSLKEIAADIGGMPGGNGGTSLGDLAGRPGGPHPWAKQLIDFNARAVGLGAKAGLVPSGSIVVPLPAPPVVQDAVPVRRLRQLLAIEDAPGGHYSYLEQTVRDWAAAEVPAGQEKPESTFGLTKREGEAPVVATVSEPIDRFLLTDAPAINQFVGSELSQAVEAAIEAAAVAELAAANLQAISSTVDDLTALRLSIAALENRGVNASGILAHPDSWAGIELQRTDDNAFLLRPDAPLDTVSRRAWSVPVVTTTAVHPTVAYVGDFRNYARYFAPDRGAVRLDWSENVGSDFTSNLRRFRCETRNKLALLLKPAFVQVTLSAT
jgi:HK97 family phage major capsid protein